MAKEKKFITCDGNEAAAHVSYRTAAREEPPLTTTREKPA